MLTPPVTCESEEKSKKATLAHQSYTCLQQTVVGYHISPLSAAGDAQTTEAV